MDRRSGEDRRSSEPALGDRDGSCLAPYQGGVAVSEVSWDESGWDLVTLPVRDTPQEFPTLVEWRPRRTGGLTGRLLYRPSIMPGARYHTERILEVRRFSPDGAPVAFAADGNSYRLGLACAADEAACREWLELRLDETERRPWVGLRILAGERTTLRCGAERRA